MWPLLNEVGEGECRHEYTTRQEYSRASWLIPFYAIHSYISILVQHHILQEAHYSFHHLKLASFYYLISKVDTLRVGT